MSLTDFGSELDKQVFHFVRKDFTPHFGERGCGFGTNPMWKRLAALGTELWLDTGDIEAADELWTREFTALTTNNTLLNKEIQKGIYDAFIQQADQLLDKHPELTEKQRRLELAFILNARHGLRLVEKFDAFVSVEEHTDLSNDTAEAINYARRFHAVCPERFYVKIPFSPAGLLATRAVAAEGIPVNHTLGFSARQNYVIARLARPAYVNVFMGRNNAFVRDNELGSGDYVGERSTLASQAAVRELRERAGIETRQIGASFREGAQVRDLAGLDVMTMPPKVAKEFLDLRLKPERLSDQTAVEYECGINGDVDQTAVGLDTLWDVPDVLVACLDELEKAGVDGMTADGLIDFFAEHGCGDVLVRWTDEQIKDSAEEGKIPKLANWREPLAEGKVGLDSLMNLAGYNSFAGDQAQMDQHVQKVLSAGRGK